MSERRRAALRSLTINDVARLRAGIAVSTSSECWPWSRARSDTNYGRITIQGISFDAHRVVLFLATGVIGDVARHKCDNPPCCNPTHLQWGTAYDNRHDCIGRGRDARGPRHGSVTVPGCAPAGERAPKAMLTNAQATEIRARHAAGTAGGVLASEYGLRHGVVSAIVNGYTYRETLPDGYQKRQPSAPTNAKLTDEQAADVRSRHRQGERQCDIARSMGVRPNVIFDIVVGRTYGRAAGQRRAEDGRPGVEVTITDGARP